MVALATRVVGPRRRRRDLQAALRMAKRMIVDGRMPTPEQARQQLEREQQRKSPASRFSWTRSSGRSPTQSCWPCAMLRPLSISHEDIILND
jgi:hypothetical protein